ncbi:MAG: hypothetical protein KBD78_10200, partial [Oligoflexales bacterium]|nr:hypothetical protein [Oligoflexales bacterium]
MLKIKIKIKSKNFHPLRSNAFALLLLFIFSSITTSACSSSSTKPKETKKEEVSSPIKVPVAKIDSAPPASPNVVSKKPRNPVNLDRKDVTFYVLNESVTPLQMQLNNLWISGQVEMTPQ